MKAISGKELFDSMNEMASMLAQLKHVSAGEIPCVNCHGTGWRRPDELAGVVGLYASMSTDDLLLLRNAFEVDGVEADRLDSIVFAAGRLALIARELQKRKACVP